MSRIPSATTSVSLTERLDKLEQSITLTLQEIDHNFSRANAIVTSRILPIVDEYSKNSNAVWEGSKFWKQFFESSANVSLSGIEEKDAANDNTIVGKSLENPGMNIGESLSCSDDDDYDAIDTRKEEFDVHDEDYDSFLENADITESTPRAPKLKQTRKDLDLTGKGLSSEKSRKEIESQAQKWTGDYASVTESQKWKTPDLLSDPTISPHKTASKSFATTPRGDPLLHRILDKNYRLQVTPIVAPKLKNTPCNKGSWRDLASPLSSPPAAAPQLHADLFSSPTRPQLTKVTSARIPGVSVQTPMKDKLQDMASKLTVKDEISWESDSEEDAEGIYRELGMSPPKTIQFNLPQSKLLQTPAREASQRIVQDLLATAGVGFDESDTDNSPSMVVRSEVFDGF